MRVVFVINEYSLHNHIVSSYVKARPQDKVALVKVPLVVKGRSRAETARKMLPKMAPWFVTAKGIEFLSLFALTFLPKLLPRGAVFQRLRRIASLHGLPFMKAHNVMSKDSLEFIRSQEPDIVVTLFHQIVKEPLISLPRIGVVNIHPGLLPEFGGVQPYFWCLERGAQYSGATLHLIEDDGIDTGRLLAQTHFSVRQGMSVQLNYYLTSLSAAKVLPSCLSLLERKEIAPVVQDLSRRGYYGFPDTPAVRRLLERHHKIVSVRDLWGILSGEFDHFEPEETILYGKGKG